MKMKKSKRNIKRRKACWKLDKRCYYWIAWKYLKTFKRKRSQKFRFHSTKYPQGKNRVPLIFYDKSDMFFRLLAYIPETYLYKIFSNHLLNVHKLLTLIYIHDKICSHLLVLRLYDILVFLSSQSFAKPSRLVSLYFSL